MNTLCSGCLCDVFPWKGCLSFSPSCSLCPVLSVGFSPRIHCAICLSFALPVTTSLEWEFIWEYQLREIKISFVKKIALFRDSSVIYFYLNVIERKWSFPFLLSDFSMLFVILVVMFQELGWILAAGWGGGGGCSPFIWVQTVVRASSSKGRHRWWQWPRGVAGLHSHAVSQEAPERAKSPEPTRRTDVVRGLHHWPFHVCLWAELNWSVYLKPGHQSYGSATGWWCGGDRSEGWRGICSISRLMPWFYPHCIAVLCISHSVCLIFTHTGELIKTISLTRVSSIQLSRRTWTLFSGWRLDAALALSVHSHTNTFPRVEQNTPKVQPLHWCNAGSAHSALVTRSVYTHRGDTISQGSPRLAEPFLETAVGPEYLCSPENMLVFVLKGSLWTMWLSLLDNCSVTKIF